MAKKLKSTTPITLPEWHRFAAFALLPEQDYDELAVLPPGTLFIHHLQPNTAAKLADATILTRKKRLYVALSKKEYLTYAHPEGHGERFKAGCLRTTREQRSDGVYEIKYVTPVRLQRAIVDTLPDWAIAYLEQAAEGYGNESDFERLMWELCITPEQKAFLNQHNLSLNHLSEGRYDGTLCDQIYQFYADWNAKLGEPFWLQ